MSGNTLSDIELTILSLVAEGQRYGAEIEQLIDRRGMRDWLPVGSASIYYILSRLEQQELLTSSHRRNDSAERAAYQITDAGRGVVQTAITELLSRPRALVEGFSLGLANSGALRPAQVYQALLQHRDDLAHQLQATEALVARRDSEAEPSVGMEALYSHGVAMMQAEVQWLTRFIDDWQSQYPIIDHDEKREPDESTQTPLHRRTVSSARDKQIQRLKPPKSRPKGE
jgi:DNA-binding PadR family transcriptional regulator